jgi:hypothetical protein
MHVPTPTHTLAHTYAYMNPFILKIISQVDAPVAFPNADVALDAAVALDVDVALEGPAKKKARKSIPLWTQLVYNKRSVRNLNY